MPFKFAQNKVQKLITAEMLYEGPGPAQACKH